MAFSMKARLYIAVYGEWKNPADDARYRDWATKCMKEMEPYSKGIQLADENLAQRPMRFVSDENLARLDEIRARRDPDGMFHTWMGRWDRPG